MLKFDAWMKVMAFIFLAVGSNAGAQAAAVEHDWVSKDGKTIAWQLPRSDRWRGDHESEPAGFSRAAGKPFSRKCGAGAESGGQGTCGGRRHHGERCARQPEENRGTFTVDGKTSTIFSLNVQRNGTTSYVIETVVHLNVGNGSISSTGFKLKCQSGKEYGFSMRPVDRPLKKVDGVTVMEMKLRTRSAGHGRFIDRSVRL